MGKPKPAPTCTIWAIKPLVYLFAHAEVFRLLPDKKRQEQRQSFLKALAGVKIKTLRRLSRNDADLLESALQEVQDLWGDDQPPAIGEFIRKITNLVK